MLILDMKMPKCCDECLMLDDSGDYPMCRITQETRGYTFNTREKRMGRCPIEGELVRCKDCRWGKEACGNIECNVDLNLPSEYHGYEWFCPNGERAIDAAD